MVLKSGETKKKDHFLTKSCAIYILPNLKPSEIRKADISAALTIQGK